MKRHSLCGVTYVQKGGEGEGGQLPKKKWIADTEVSLSLKGKMDCSSERSQSHSAALPWPLVIFQILCFVLFLKLEARCSGKKSTHARSHVKPCLICKAKPTVTPAVPAADCCPASLPPLLQAQTMTAWHQENPR